MAKVIEIKAQTKKKELQTKKKDKTFKLALWKRHLDLKHSFKALQQTNSNDQMYYKALPKALEEITQQFQKRNRFSNKLKQVRNNPKQKKSADFDIIFVTMEEEQAKRSMSC